MIETKDTINKRQKIGRGLRIAVNEDGERVPGFAVNTLTVMANESYKDFAEGLQKNTKKMVLSLVYLIKIALRRLLRITMKLRKKWKFLAKKNLSNCSTTSNRKNLLIHPGEQPIS